MARTSAGTYVSSRLAGPPEPGEGEPDASLEMDELLCVTVDACGRSSSGFTNVHFRYSSGAGVDAGEDAQLTVDEPCRADEGRRSEACSSFATPQAGHAQLQDCPGVCCIWRS